MYEIYELDSVECFYTHTCELGKGVYAHVTKTDIQ